jgi:spermidine/putrescine transport system permease protein
MTRAGSLQTEAVKRRLLVGLPTLVLLVLFAAPTLIMVLATFQFPDDFGGLAPAWYSDSDGVHLDLTLENYERFAGEAIYLKIFWRSLVYATLTTLFCAALAYPLAMFITRAPSRIRDLLVLLVILPFWSNFLIRVYAWMSILGPRSLFTEGLNGLLGWFGLGPVTLLFTPFAVIVGLVYVHLPFMVLPLYANLCRHDPAWLDAARDLGASPWKTFVGVTLPMSVPGLVAGSLLVFIPALGAFAVPDILGGAQGAMIGNLISDQFLSARDWPFGSTIAVALTLFVVFIAWLMTAVARRLPGGAAHAR